jgi:hypothetical protein
MILDKATSRKWHEVSWWLCRAKVAVVITVNVLLAHAA